MSSWWIGHISLVLSLVLATASQVLFKSLLNQLGDLELSWLFVHSMFAEGRFWRWLLAGVMLVAGFLCWLLCLKQLDLSYVYPLAAASTVLVPLFSVVFLGERVDLRMWVGIICIVVGTALITRPR